MRKIFFFIFVMVLLYIFSCATIEEKENKVEFRNLKTPVCNIKISVIGKGAPPTDANLSEVQKYIFSERAAILDGYRLISEQMSGIILDSVSKSDNFIITSDSVKAITKTFLKGVKINSIKHKENGVCEAGLELVIPKKLFYEYLYSFPVKPVKKNENCNKQKCINIYKKF